MGREGLPASPGHTTPGSGGQPGRRRQEEGPALPSAAPAHLGPEVELLRAVAIAHGVVFRVEHDEREGSLPGTSQGMQAGGLSNTQNEEGVPASAWRAGQWAEASPASGTRLPRGSPGTPARQSAPAPGRAESAGKAEEQTPRPAGAPLSSSASSSSAPPSRPYSPKQAVQTPPPTWSSPRMTASVTRRYSLAFRTRVLPCMVSGSAGTNMTSTWHGVPSIAQRMAQPHGPASRRSARSRRARPHPDAGGAPARPSAVAAMLLPRLSGVSWYT